MMIGRMRIVEFIVIVMMLFVSACSSSDGKVDLNVIVGSRHPFLVDHSRYLTINNNAGEIDRIKPYPETGAGQTTVVVESESVYSVIDCNGFWYEISKRDGNVSEFGFEWLKPLPKGKIKKYFYNKETRLHEFVELDAISLEEVYRIKDPGKP